MKHAISSFWTRKENAVILKSIVYQMRMDSYVVKALPVNTNNTI